MVIAFSPALTPSVIRLTTMASICRFSIVYAPFFPPDVSFSRVRKNSLPLRPRGTSGEFRRIADALTHGRIKRGKLPYGTGCCTKRSPSQRLPAVTQSALLPHRRSNAAPSACDLGNPSWHIVEWRNTMFLPLGGSVMISCAAFNNRRSRAVEENKTDAGLLPET